MIGKPIYRLNNKNHLQYILANPYAINIIDNYINELQNRNYYIYNSNIDMNPSAIYIIQLLKNKKDKINCFFLSSNLNAIRIIEKNLETINWISLSYNPNAIPIIEKNLDKVYWNYLSSNPNAIHILENNLDKICWRNLSSNPNAIHILENNLDKVDWEQLNSNPNAICILENNLDKIHWSKLSLNLNAIHIIEKRLNDKNDWSWKLYPESFNRYINQGVYSMYGYHPDDKIVLEMVKNEICWFNLCKNPNAIKLIEKNIDLVSWYYLSSNPKAISILEKHIDKIWWDEFSKNPNSHILLDKYPQYIRYINLKYAYCYQNSVHLMASIDYKKMKNNMKEFKEELLAYIFNPSRISNLSKIYNIDFLEFINLY